MEIEQFLTQQIKPNEKFFACFVSIDIVGSSKLIGSNKEIEKTKSNLKSFIEALVNEDSIAVFKWMGDGGILIYNTSNGFNDITIFCDKLVNILPVFNKTRGICNTLNIDNINLRIVLHAGMCTNTGDPDTFTSDELNAVSKHERDVGIANHIVVTENVYKELSPELKVRFSNSQKEKHEELGYTYVMDMNESITTVQLNNHKSENLISWLRKQIQNSDYDQIDIFSYTNETLSSFVGSLRDIKVRVLVRDWIIEFEERTAFNKKLDEKDSDMESFKRRWLKSGQIKTNAEFLRDKIDSSEDSEQLCIKFYKQRPSIKGAILRNSKTAQRTAHFGFYDWKPVREGGGSPYVGSKWSGIWLTDDHGPNLRMISALGEYFEELWIKGKTYDELLEKEEKIILSEKEKNSLISIWELEANSKYTVICPGRKIENRESPAIATEDLNAFRCLEQTLNKPHVSVTLRMVKDSYFKDKGKELEDMFKNSDDHLVLICMRTINKFLYDLLQKIKFPFSLELDVNNELLIRDNLTPSVVIKSNLHDGEDINVDYCLIAKFDNPIPEKDNKIFIIAGIRAMGTYAGAKYLTNGSELLSLCKNVGRDNFAAVIKCSFTYPDIIQSVSPYIYPINFFNKTE